MFHQLGELRVGDLDKSIQLDSLVHHASCGYGNGTTTQHTGLMLMKKRDGATRSRLAAADGASGRSLSRSSLCCLLQGWLFALVYFKEGLRVWDWCDDDEGTSQQKCTEYSHSETPE